MSVDLRQLNYFSGASALKLWRQGSGSGIIPATALPSSPPQFQRIPIPHGYGSDELIYRVMVEIPSAPPPFNTFFVVSYRGGGNYVTASIDETNLYIEAGNASSGSPALSFNYYYRILIP